jgi:putative ATPase
MFEAGSARAPLAERMRPARLEDFVGQEGILGPGTALRRSIEADTLGSLILWGPPGSGKTSLARIIAARTKARYVPFSAVLSGIKEVQQVMRSAEENRKAYGQRTVLFVDEIHRFNRAQQDAFLPYVERGDIILIGATTENPSFEVNSALLSRARVYVLEPLAAGDIERLIRRALASPDGLAEERLVLPDDLVSRLAAASQGDARTPYNALEVLAATVPPSPDGMRHVTREALADALQTPVPRYDAAGEEHFNIISALHKSLRNSDPDAAIYWLARMLESGEDPLYIARRMVRFASEDVGLADPRALTIALAAKDAVHFLGRPEGDLALAEAAVYLATAPRSNALYTAYGEATAEIRAGTNPPVPLHLRNAVTGLMRGVGYGRGYRYAHDEDEGVADMSCLPAELATRRYYRPTERGFEKTLRERLDGIARMRERARRKE